MRFKSTCSYNDDYYSYDRVQRLSCGQYLPFDFLHIHFSNIRDLVLRLPIPSNFSRIVPSLYHLNSLSVWISNDSDPHFQLQVLLDNAPRLYSLKLHSAQSSSHVLPIELKSKTIRRLDLQSNCQPFNERICTTLSRSSLGIHCEVLTITVENRTIVLDLVNNMKNLRVLIVASKDDTCTYSDLLISKEDKLVEWLHQSLSPTCTISRSKNRFITLWIR